MQHIVSDTRGSFYVDFHRGLLYLFSRTSRIGQSSRFSVNKQELKLNIQNPSLRKAFDQSLQIACLAMMERYEQRREENEAHARFMEVLNLDLNDDACRDINSFGSPK